jgi:catechol 2,3-dioxygenase-like lactoylglutathione lyase family enzyme
MIIGFNHTGFVVRDLEKMTAFYRDVLGLTVQLEFEAEGEFISKVLGFPDVRAGITFLSKEGAGHSLELLQYLGSAGGDGHSARNDAGATHLCLSVDDLEATYKELSARGVRFVNPPAAGDSPLGPIKLCLAQDPEGNWLELIELSG